MRPWVLSALLTPWLWACSAPSLSDEALDEEAQPIVDGVASGPEQNAVVDLSVQDVLDGVGAVGCTGTMVAPNLVLTSRRCLSPFNDHPNLRFRCTSEGYIDLASPRIPINGGELGLIADPEDVWVFVGRDPDQETPDAQGVEIFSYATESVCRNDIAYVLLDRPLDPEPKPLRLNGGASLGELTRVIGHAGNYNEDTWRQERRDVPVLATGEGPYTEQTGATPVRTFMLGESACRQRDAGAPSLSEDTGAVLGVFSYTAGEDCESAEVRNVFTQVAAYRDLVAEAFEAAGHEPQLEERDAMGSGGAGGQGELSDGATTDGSAGGDGERDEDTADLPRRGGGGSGCACELGQEDLPQPRGVVVTTLAVAFFGWRRRLARPRDQQRGNREGIGV